MITLLTLLNGITFFNRKYLSPVVIRVVDKIKPHGCILKTDYNSFLC